MNEYIERAGISFWRLSAYMIPRRWHRGAGRFAGWVFMQLPVRKRQYARLNMELCFPSFTKAEIDALLIANAAMIGQAIWDAAIAWFWSDDRIKAKVPYRIQGLDLLKKDDGKGVLLLFKHSLHFMLDARILSLHHDIYGVTRDVKNAGYFNRLYMEKRVSACKGIALPNQAMRFVRWLRKGHTLCYAMDHDYGLEGSIITKFFDVPAATLVAPYKMRQLTGCRVCTMNSYYDEKGVLVMEITAQDDLDDSCQQRFLQALNDETTKQIARHPQEYHWYYGRFKSTGMYKDLTKRSKKSSDSDMNKPDLV